MPMPTPGQLRAIEIYAALLEEVKIRVAAIDAGTSGALNVIPPPLVREHCYLQIRMVCEIVALGCLIAHGDIALKSKKLRVLWAADEIMERLERLHPDFYPKPYRLQRDGNAVEANPVTPHPLPKSELVRLYRKCGEILHRGSIKRMLTAREPLVIHYPDITAIAQKLVDLLAQHLIFMADGRTLLICMHVAQPR